MWGILTIRLDALWFGHHDENGRWISTAARNYALYGADELNYLVTVTSHPATLEQQERYVNHPPLIVWFVSLAADAFGRYDEESPFVTGSPYESSARFVPIAATIISLCALFVLVRRLFNVRIAWITLILYCFTPMTMYFGRMPNHEPLALMWLYLFAAIFVNWMRRYTHRRTIALIMLGGLAMWTAWASAFFLFTMGIVALIYGKRQQRIGIVGIGLGVGVITLLLGMYYVLAFPDTISTLQDAFTYRTSNASFRRGSESFTMLEFIVRQLTHSLTAMTFGVILLGFAGIVIILRRRVTFAYAMVLALIVAAFLYMLVFRNAFYIHDYYKIYFMVGFCMAAAVAVDAANNAKRRGLTKYARPLVLSIVIVSSVLGFVWSGVLHLSGTSTIQREIITTLQAETAQDDIIFTDLRDAIRSFEYYAYRRIMGDSAVADAQRFVADGDVWYLRCSGDEHPSDGGIMIADTCELIRVTD